MRLVAPADHRVADESLIEDGDEAIEPALGARAVACKIVRIEGGLGILQGGSQLSRHLHDGSTINSPYSLNLVSVLAHIRHLRQIDTQDCRIISVLRRKSIGSNAHWPPGKPSIVLARCCRAVAAAVHRGTRHSVP